MTLKTLRNWICALGFGGLIWYVSSLPLHGPVFANAAKKHLDWVAHAVEYGLFAVLLFEAMRRTIVGRGRVKRALILAALVASIFAVADEIHQSAIPYRVPSVADAWADMAGIVIGLSIRMWRLVRKHA